eukprot:scaffold36018_cov191-Amphora_coffeaeformis.AAC.2
MEFYPPRSDSKSSGCVRLVTVVGCHSHSQDPPMLLAGRSHTRPGDINGALSQSRVMMYHTPQP